MRIAVLAFLPAFASAAVASTVVDVEFMASGGAKYRTSKLVSSLKANYGENYTNAKVLLIETASLGSESYTAQSKALNALGHESEKYRVLFVGACPDTEYKGGYHTSRETAQKLMANKTTFRVRLLNQDGLVLKESTRPVVGKELRSWLTEK
jgi:hypothetical protein